MTSSLLRLARIVLLGKVVVAGEEEEVGAEVRVLMMERRELMAGVLSWTMLLRYAKLSARCSVLTTPSHRL
tara:strand:+ start:1056 stop:1268 length:213 start_codon:yes stop_codon:yes gene_type:complete